MGKAVVVTCDSCPVVLRFISLISREAEYTPPVIFSEQERAKLVFRVEAQASHPSEPAHRPSAERQHGARREAVMQSLTTFAHAYLTAIPRLPRRS